MNQDFKSFVHFLCLLYSDASVVMRDDGVAEEEQEISFLQAIPRIPDGHRQFQFYTLGQSGTLQKQWMSLQEVQVS